MQIDERDKQLIALLKKNGRESVVSLSKQLGVSRATVQNRIELLERRKVIKGFTLVMDDDYQKRLLRVLMSINLQAGVSRKIVKALQTRPLVTKILSVSGSYDLIIEITVETGIELDKEIDDIREMEGIEQTVTSVVLAEY